MGDITVGAVLLGLVRGVNLAYPLNSGQAFLLNLVLGIVLGALHLFGLSGIEAGVIASLVSTGVYQVAKKVGGE